jgi:hypothetical protein
MFFLFFVLRGLQIARLIVRPLLRLRLHIMRGIGLRVDVALLGRCVGGVITALLMRLVKTAGCQHEQNRN